MSDWWWLLKIQTLLQRQPSWIGIPLFVWSLLVIVYLYIFTLAHFHELTNLQLDPIQDLPEKVFNVSAASTSGHSVDSMAVIRTAYKRNRFQKENKRISGEPVKFRDAVVVSWECAESYRIDDTPDSPKRTARVEFEKEKDKEIQII